MTEPRIGVATCAAAPQLDEDGPLLLAALADVGVRARPVVWDDPRVDWAAFDAVLVRSTWDYPLRREEFLAWTARCPAMVNPREVLAWNTDKHYLDDLARAGVPTIPTVFVPPDHSWTAPEGDYVVKPTVSGSAADTGRFRRPDDPGALALVARLHAQGRTAMVQPYLPGIERDGETSVVFLGGVLSHAVRREPLLTVDGVRAAVVVADVLGSVREVRVTDAQRAVAEAALAAVPGGRQQLGYARVDLVPGPTGPVVLEVEATDCFLFLASASAEGRRRLAEHVVAQL
ncbi:ATP-grasp domain-containing protein [Modestobacter altitudinis]|uniref:ATP-grasp domain-containing protein n=1 Tax=Modestobacter altitudinis TaxID=2213158 RepID=UPI00110CE34D|nr:hypothetical protein [Modestobacter altitudinis]